MMNWVLLLLPFAGGVMIAFQSGVNGMLGKNIGVFEASTVNFIVGTLLLTVTTLVFGKGDFSAVLTVPKWQWIGGMLGAAYVLIVVLTIPKVGVASVLIAIIAGQLITGALIDHYGLFGTRITFDWNRAIGLLCMAAAIFFFYRK